MTVSDIETISVEVQELLRKKLDVRGRTLGESLQKSGRLLPRWLQQQGEVLAEAEMKVVHPKLARQIDIRAVERAHRSMVTHLKTIDPKDRRIGRVLNVLGGLTFNMILFFALLITVLVWRGFV
jgi:hypothetical protein